MFSVNFGKQEDDTLQVMYRVFKTRFALNKIQNVSTRIGRNSIVIYCRPICTIDSTQLTET